MRPLESEVYDQHYGVSLARRFHHNKPPTSRDVPQRMAWSALDIPDPEDLLICAARKCLAVRAVLAHPDAVSIAPAGDDEHRLTVRRGRRLLSGGRAGCHENEGENGDERGAHEGDQGSSVELGVCVLGQNSSALSKMAYFQADSWTRARALSGSHQPRFASYQATVSASPSSKPCAGAQPSSFAIFDASSR